jgi:hypothetical protein
MVSPEGGREAMEPIRCAHCQQFIVPNPHIKNQHYCNSAACQRARKTLWQKQKLKTDSDYKANQKDCQKQWRENHPGYWRNWRAEHPEYSKRNCIQQQERNRQRAFKIAKMDASKTESFIKSGCYFIIPELLGPVIIAKMDTSVQKVRLILDG